MGVYMFMQLFMCMWKLKHSLGVIHLGLETVSHYPGADQQASGILMSVFPGQELHAFIKLSDILHVVSGD